MLKTTTQRKRRLNGGRIAIVAALYNPRFVDGMLNAALEEFAAAGVESPEVFRVPGSYEIPVVVAQVLARGPARPEAIVCLGVIIQGETAHAHHIGTAITDALMGLQVQFGTPVVHEVLLVQNESQAEARCLDQGTNRGAEAAQTAIDMVTLFREKGFGVASATGR